VDGDADAAVEARIQTGWNKFRHLEVGPLLSKQCLPIMREDYTVAVFEAVCCMEVRPGLLGTRMSWHFSKQRSEWSGGCVR